jgi:bifunctional enzyme CysN/CysC
MNVLVTEPSGSSVAAGTASKRPLVRIVIVGHVDHGKSTLIGRLLHETGSLPDGKLEALQAVSARRGMPFEWSFLLDALQTERDQGITLDTSQIRFRTSARDFVLIDAPGHAEFLRNMITGAAQADAALLIVDAAEGVRDQTRRHGYLLHLLGVRQVAVVINKMDRVSFAEAKFREIEAEISTHLVNLGLSPTAVIPISARDGDGVARRTPSIGWYAGPSVVETLDRFVPARQADELALRLPVQAVYKFDDLRIVAGRIETGSLTVGEEIVVMPAGRTARVRSIESWPAPEQPAESAGAGESVGITLDSEIFLDRGDVVSTAAVRPKAAQRLRARVFWLHGTPLEVGSSLNVRVGTAEARGTIVGIEKAVDPGQLSATETKAVAQNHVGEIELALARPLAIDPYAVNARTGRIVLDIKGRISGGGLVLSLDSSIAAAERPRRSAAVKPASSAQARAAHAGHDGAVVWLTGPRGAGKAKLARALEQRLFERGGAAVVLDEGGLRAGLNGDLGGRPADHAEILRRTAEIAAYLARGGFIAVVVADSPSASGRARAREIGGKGFYEVHVDAATGADRAFEAPSAPDLRLETQHHDLKSNSLQVEQMLEMAGVIHSNAQPPGGEFAI